MSVGEIGITEAGVTRPDLQGSTRTRNLAVIAAAVVVAASSLVAGYAVWADSTASASGATVIGEEQLTHDLVKTGQIPDETLQLGVRTEQEALRDLVNQGLVPRAALDR